MSLIPLLFLLKLMAFVTVPRFTLHLFWYPFAGSVHRGPSGWPFTTGWSITGITPGTWRYNGNP